jgi:hypothetical protein
MYLAPSSIPGSGLGMYVGNMTYKVDELVTYEDVVIPIFERDWHSNVKGNFLWDEYIWNGPVFDGMDEEMENGDMDEIAVASPGVGSAANSYMALVNVDDSSILMDNAQLSSDSPGRGAFTIFHGRSWFATEPMRPGQEVFVAYGNRYFRTRSRIYGYLPLPSDDDGGDDDYTRADDLLNRMLDVTLDNERLEKHLKNNNKKNNKKGWSSFLSSPSNHPEETSNPLANIFADLHALVVSTSELFKKSRILNAIPRNASMVETILEDGGTAWQHFNRSIKDLEWLEENGQCMDNIRHQTSTIPHAGRGAFATRAIPKGGLVSPAPLIHIQDSEMIEMFFDLKRNRKGLFVPDRTGRWSYQLIINYCFGHEESHLLLCPYGLLSSLINHSHDKPNTKIQWAKEMRHKEWLQQPIEKWGDTYHTGLQFDFVATRDIAKGEEILIDYGDAWQKAWDEHVESFHVPEPKTYVPAYELNSIIHELEFRTVDDREYELDNVRLHCNWDYLRRKGILKPRNAGYQACEIIRKLKEDSYLVRLLSWEDEDDNSKYTPGKLVWGLPKDAFYFRDLPFTRDHHQVWAFRHAMQIPDEIFPDVWKNNKAAEEEGKNSV